MNARGRSAQRLPQVPPNAFERLRVAGVGSVNRPAELGVLQSHVGLEQRLARLGVGMVEGAEDVLDRGLEAGVVELAALVLGQGGEQPGPRALVVTSRQAA